MNPVLEDPITIDELRNSISKGKLQKAPGHDGIGLGFYKTAREGMKHGLLQILKLQVYRGYNTGKATAGIYVLYTET